MLMFLFIPLGMLLALLLPYLFFFLFDNSTKRFKKSKKTIIVINICTICLLGIIICPIVFSHLTKNLNYETTTIEIDAEECYMVKNMFDDRNKENLLLYSNSSGELIQVWVNYVETDSAPYLEIKEYTMSKFEKILLLEMKTEYTLYANPQYLHISSDINDVPLEKLK